MPTKVENSVCEECKLNPYKYKCPGCSIRSCSLTCVKAHKQRTDCTGKRKRTEFVPLSKFDDNTLLSDYNMLEETKRVAESALRLRNQLTKYPQFKLPYDLQSLRNAAASRGTKLLYLPSGMLKRENNQSRYDKKMKFISWTIEWQFHSTDVVLTDHGISEEAKLCTVMENHLKPSPWINKLKPFCDVDMNSLKLFIRQYPKGAKSRRFKELNIKAPLRPQLDRVTVLEYPVIYVYLPLQSHDFEVIKDFYRVETTTSSLDNCHASAYGIPAPEEEIVEDEDVIEESKTENDVSHPLVDTTEEVNMEELEFEHSNLFEEMNRDKYFNFEYEFAKGLDSDEDANNLKDLATDLNNNEE